jgi:hypothetical protein
MDMIGIHDYLKMAGVTGVKAQEVKSRSRKQFIAIARESWWCYNAERYGLGISQLARIDGRKSATVWSGMRTFRNLLETGHPLARPYAHLFGQAV